MRLELLGVPSLDGGRGSLLNAATPASPSSSPGNGHAPLSPLVLRVFLRFPAPSTLRMVEAWLELGEAKEAQEEGDPWEGGRTPRHPHTTVGAAARVMALHGRPPSPPHLPPPLCALQ